jgi:hypothetical protein
VNAGKVCSSGFSDFYLAQQEIEVFQELSAAIFDV